MTLVWLGSAGFTCGVRFRARVDCWETVRRVVDALELGDQAGFEQLVSPSVAWEISAGEGGAETLTCDQLDGLVDRLRSYGDQRRMKEVVRIAGSVVVRTEGTITPPGGATYSGTGFAVYDCDGGLVIRRRTFAYRKQVLDALEVPRAERQGLLVIRDDDDERLYHFGIGRGSKVTWAHYSEVGTSDHHHCELCWAKFTAHEGVSALRVSCSR